MLPLLLMLIAPQGDALPGWLAGTWCTEAAAARQCEEWASPAAGTMLGQGYVDRADKPRTVTEAMRIVAEPRLAFYGQPKGQGSTRFEAVKAEARRIVFAAPDHDYPKRIEYRLEGDMLVATISGADPAKDSRSWRYRRRG